MVDSTEKEDDKDLISSSLSSFPFDRIDIARKKLTTEQALQHFERYGFLWIKQQQQQQQQTNTNNNKSSSILSRLRNLHKTDPNFLTKKWSIENNGGRNTDQEKEDLSVDAVLLNSGNTNKLQKQGFYVSTILSRRRQEPSENNINNNNLLLDRFLKDSFQPFHWDTTGNGTTPPILGDSCTHTGGAWLFLGRNNNYNNENEQSSEATEREEERKPNKKRKLAKPKRSPLIGRAEHVDDVQHSGTWHIQLAGTKTWYLRPNSDCEDWEETEEGIPNLRSYLGHNNNTPHVVKIIKGPPIRLCCHVEEGDLFLLNTKAWYHRTELPPSTTTTTTTTSSNEDDDMMGWSISIARDFNLPIPTIYCPRNVTKGEVIFEEDDIPHRFPTANNNDGEEPNCTMAEIAVEGEEAAASAPDEDDDDDDDKDDESESGGGAAATSIVLLALRDIAKGEALLLEKVVLEDDDEEEEEETNAPESIDPRLIAKRDFQRGEIVLTGDAIPEDLPLSIDEASANCRLVEEEEDGGGSGELVLEAIRDISKGEILIISPDKNGEQDYYDPEEYEEVEINLGGGGGKEGLMTRKL